MTKTQRLCVMWGVFILSIPAWSMEASTIEQVYTQYNQSTTQLDAEAVKVIDDYCRKTLDTFMLSEDTEKLVELRLEINKYKGSDFLSFYASAFQKTAKEHLKVALDTVSKWDDEAKRLRIERNLMILIAELGNAGLAELALPKLSGKDPMVRYWAVRALTSAEVIKQSKPDSVTRDDNRTSQILSGLEQYLKTTSDTATTTLIINFAFEINTTASRKMYCDMADRRIEAYMKWTVTDEQLDADLLKSLASAGISSTDTTQKQELLSRFGQLYSCVLSRYIQGNKIPGIAKEKLISVIVEVEDKVLVKTVSWASKFRTDLNMNKPLGDDYALLFGSNGQAGDLTTKLNFNYGKDSTGKPLINPRPLPAPPAAVTKETAAAKKP